MENYIDIVNRLDELEFEVEKINALVHAVYETNWSKITKSDSLFLQTAIDKGWDLEENMKKLSKQIYNNEPLRKLRAEKHSQPVEEIELANNFIAFCLKRIEKGQSVKEIWHSWEEESQNKQLQEN